MEKILSQKLKMGENALKMEKTDKIDALKLLNCKILYPLKLFKIRADSSYLEIKSVLEICGQIENGKLLYNNLDSVSNSICGYVFFNNVKSQEMALKMKRFKLKKQVFKVELPKTEEKLNNGDLDKKLDESKSLSENKNSENLVVVKIKENSKNGCKKQICDSFDFLQFALESKRSKRLIFELKKDEFKNSVKEKLALLNFIDNIKIIKKPKRWKNIIKQKEILLNFKAKLADRKKLQYILDFSVGESKKISFASILGWTNFDDLAKAEIVLNKFRQIDKNDYFKAHFAVTETSKNKNSIIVKNLAEKTQKDKIANRFGLYGKIEKIDFHSANNICSVGFQKAIEANQAFSLLQNDIDFFLDVKI
ncbi:Polyadenylate-binding protein 4, variant 2 [Bonamia ostreae]|uniref:Polyadenylate-binding protein 4, variant 2 n=1 Tax=Bonamia ostreae TaxID=126728 RepID=A0ABV2AGR2_9EUKA